ncbi:MAG TPA: tRNA (adenosine(37)-N6)-threonylcarbamoyltransferase complex dimerization subunit type 1 TsaB [Gammaproteobacteria bacterium]|nr:tRNA (adenosine(37)-N6)-threonylcarbamoyltransferase complex dimerization subunit type 1 TsaB [Gammaproteobacteria bacterium]
MSEYPSVSGLKPRALLAVETSTSVCSVALLKDHQLFEAEELRPNRHSQVLLPMIQQLLLEAAIRLPELDGIAVGRGPGSFTGIRIGIAAVQGLAFATGLPIIAVSSLASLAVQAQFSHVLAILDARMQQLYWGRYCIGHTPDGDLLATLQGQEYVSDPEQVWIPEVTSWIGVGRAWSVYASRLQGSIARLDKLVEDCRPTAAATVQLAVSYFKEGRVTRPDHIEPAYLRNEVATKPGSDQHST